MSNCQPKLTLNVSHVRYCMDSTFETVLIITSRLHAIDQLLQAKNKLLKIPQQKMVMPAMAAHNLPRDRHHLHQPLPDRPTPLHQGSQGQNAQRHLMA